MIALKLKILGLAAAYGRFVYYHNRRHRNHLGLTGIMVHMLGCVNGMIHDFVMQSIIAAGSPPSPDGLNFVEFYGGSTHGAQLSLEESGRWLRGFAAGLGLEIVILTEHRRGSGRFDFHVLAPEIQPGKVKVTTRDFLQRARSLARELTDQLNRERLAKGGDQPVIGNLTEDFKVYYLPREPIRQTDIAPVMTKELSAPTENKKAAPAAKESAKVSAPAPRLPPPGLADSAAEKKKADDAERLKREHALAERLWRELLEHLKLFPHSDEEWERPEWRAFAKSHDISRVSLRTILHILVPLLEASPAARHWSSEILELKFKALARAHSLLPDFWPEISRRPDI